MSAVTDKDVDDWVDAIAKLHDDVIGDPADARAAKERAAMLWSGYGYQDAPTHVLRMFVQAIEIGYSQALREVREGRYDAEIQTWRPDLAQA